MSSEQLLEQSDNVSKKVQRRILKEYFSKERSALAENILEQRHSFFSERSRVETKLLELKIALESQRADLESIDSDLKKIEQDLEGIRDSKLKELLNFLKLRRLEKELSIKQKKKEELEKIVSEQLILNSDLEGLLLDRHQLVDIKDKVKEFYVKAEEEGKKRDLKEAVKKHDCVFLHATHPSYLPSYNSPLLEESDWRVKLNIVLGLQPTLSVSSVKKGEDGGGLWGGMGVLLKGGEVMEAHRSDAGTRTKGVSKRASGILPGKDISDDIEQAVNNHVGGYNEFVIRDPKVCGFFICAEVYNKLGMNTKYPGVAPLEEINDFLGKTKLPLYWLEMGEVYPAEIDSTSKQVVKKSETPFTPEDLLDLPDVVGELERRQIVENLFEDSPFKPEAKEMQLVDNACLGRATYFELKIREGVIAEETEREISYDEIVKVPGRDFLQAVETKAKILKELPRIGKKIIFYKDKSGDVIKVEKSRFKSDASGGKQGSRQEVISRTGTHCSLNDGWVELSNGIQSLFLDKKVVESEQDVGKKLGAGEFRPVMSRQEYMDGMKKIIDILSTYLILPDAEFRDSYLSHFQQLTYHVRGFAEEAKDENDLEFYQAAKEIVELALSESEYQDLMERRMSKSGGLKITQADLKK